MHSIMCLLCKMLCCGEIKQLKLKFNIQYRALSAEALVLSGAETKWYSPHNMRVEQVDYVFSKRQFYLYKVSKIFSETYQRCVYLNGYYKVYHLNKMVKKLYSIKFLLLLQVTCKPNISIRMLFIVVIAYTSLGLQTVVLQFIFLQRQKI